MDLESLRAVAKHPPFEPGKLGEPVPAVPELVYSPQPTFEEPVAPKGLAGAFGGKKKHAESVAKAQADLEAKGRSWHECDEEARRAPGETGGA